MYQKGKELSPCTRMCRAINVQSARAGIFAGRCTPNVTTTVTVSGRDHSYTIVSITCFSLARSCSVRGGSSGWVSSLQTTLSFADSLDRSRTVDCTPSWVSIFSRSQTSSSGERLRKHDTRTITCVPFKKERQCAAMKIARNL